MLISKAQASARKILKEYDLDNILSLSALSLKDLVQARGAYYEEIELHGKDGRIVSLNGKSIISVNRTITEIGKKRFVAAHELGHFELHRHLAVNADSTYELFDWFQSGQHEKEANDFASELLMPSRLFSDQCKEQKFGASLIAHLAETFTASRTAVILKFIAAGNHPICVFCTKNNKIKWWKMSEQMATMEHAFIPNWLRYKVKVATNLPPPIDSVVGQLLRKGQKNQNFERVQEIEKSTWFLTVPKDDPKMFEYCNYVPSYDFALSVVWES
jgi:Zn-dependent peptidase ImmA (M78 family)